MFLAKNMRLFLYGQDRSDKIYLKFQRGFPVDNNMLD